MKSNDFSVDDFFIISSYVKLSLYFITPGKSLYHACPKTKIFLPLHNASHPTVPVTVAIKIAFSVNKLVSAYEGIKQIDLILEIL